MDLELVEGFVTLAEELHFGRAAARLQIGSPTLSKRIAQLEGQWGVTLFDRTSRTVNLTPAGNTLLEPSRHVLREAKTLRDLVVEAATGAVGVVRAGYFPGTGELMMRLGSRGPRALSRARHPPGVDVDCAGLSCRGRRSHRVCRRAAAAWAGHAITDPSETPDQSSRPSARASSCRP